MNRILTTTLLGLALTANTSAAIIQFVPGTVPTDQNPLSIVGPDVFEVSDVPNAAPNDFQFNAITPIDVQVIANDGTLPVTFSLARVATANDRLNLIFNNPTYNNLVLFFDIPGLVKGDAIPGGTITDADGVVNWNAPGLNVSSSGTLLLAGTLEGSQLIPQVPEPTSLGMILLGVLGLFIQRRR